MHWFQDKLSSVTERLDRIFPDQDRPPLAIMAGLVVGAALTTPFAGLVAAEGVALYAAYRLGKGVLKALARKDEVSRVLDGFDDATRTATRQFLDKHVGTEALGPGDRWLVRRLGEEGFSIMTDPAFRELERGLAEKNLSIAIITVTDSSVTIMQKVGGKLHGVFDGYPALRVVTDGKVDDRFLQHGVVLEKSLGAMRTSAPLRA